MPRCHVDNHLTLGCLNPKFVSTIGKSELRKIPFLGISIENGGHIFIERNKLTEAISMLDLVAE